MDTLSPESDISVYCTPPPPSLLSTNKPKGTEEKTEKARMRIKSEWTERWLLVYIYIYISQIHFRFIIIYINLNDHVCWRYGRWWLVREAACHLTYSKSYGGRNQKLVQRVKKERASRGVTHVAFSATALSSLVVAGKFRAGLNLDHSFSHLFAESCFALFVRDALFCSKAQKYGPWAISQGVALLL